MLTATASFKKSNPLIFAPVVLQYWTFNKEQYLIFIQVSEILYLKLWIEGKEEGLSCAIKAIADFKGFRR